MFWVVAGRLASFPYYGATSCFVQGCKALCFPGVTDMEQSPSHMVLSSSIISSFHGVLQVGEGGLWYKPGTKAPEGNGGLWI